MTDTADRTTDTDAVAEVKGWLDENWNPDLTVAEWWKLLGESGWAVPSWPVVWFGKGLTSLAQVAGKANDPSIRQKLMKLHSLGEVARFNSLRLKAAMQAGKDIPGLPNIAKLSMSQTVRLSRDLGLEIAGGYGMLHAYDPENRKVLDEATGMPFLSGITEMALFAQGPPIYGGTDQVQRNIIGERVLGLPKEPGFDKNTPFKDLPKNG